MEISEQLRCLFSANIEERDDTYVIEVPDQELQLGDIQNGETYRVAMLSSPATTATEEAETDTEDSLPTPPVREGETRTVEIESLGEQGDGITRVERSFVVIVPDTDPGERVIVEITDVRENVAFADVVERKSYYD